MERRNDSGAEPTDSQPSVVDADETPPLAAIRQVRSDRRIADVLDDDRADRFDS